MRSSTAWCSWSDSSWTLVGVAGGLLLCWLVLVAVLWATRPDDLRLRDLLRLLPDVLANLGFVVESSGASGGSLVTALR